MASSPARRIALLLLSMLLFTTWLPDPGSAAMRPSTRSVPGCTTFYAYDGTNALGGNNEDFNNPLTLIWFIPASPGRYGRVYFGYDDFIPQGGLNDQGVFFDGLSLPYKEMPVTSQRPHFPGGDLALFDEILSRSANVQEAIDLSTRWNHLGGEYSQFMYGDRFGDSAIIDGDTILRKDGSFQLATNFRLVENPNPPYPEERYGKVADLLSEADYFTVDLFRQALDVAHAEGDFPTLYSQVYELKTGTIHLYQYHDFQHEVVIDLAEELAKGPHILTIASLFSKNKALEQWTVERTIRWKSGYRTRINAAIQPASQSWMSGDYLLENDADAKHVRVYLENDQLYLQRPYELPIELYPADSNTVFHPFFNGMDLTLTFRRNLWGQVSEARGTFSFDPYEIVVPYDLVKTGITSLGTSAIITATGVCLMMILMGFFVVRRQRRKREEEKTGAE